MFAKRISMRVTFAMSPDYKRSAFLIQWKNRSAKNRFNAIFVFTHPKVFQAAPVPEVVQERLHLKKRE